MSRRKFYVYINKYFKELDVRKLIDYHPPMGYLFIGVGLGLFVACSATDSPSIQGDPDIVSVGGTGGSNTTSSSSSGVTSSSSSSSGTDAQIGYLSGFRLKARYYDGLDGSKQWFGFYDSQLEINCQVAETTDGLKRCIPSSPSIYSLGLGTYFSNPICTQFLAHSFGSCVSPPKYATYATIGQCGTVTYEIGLVLSVHTGDIYAQSGSSCVAMSNLSYTFFHATLVSPSVFQEMKEYIEP